MKSGTTRAQADPSGAQPVPAFELGSLLGYRLQRLSAAIAALAQQESMEVGGLSLPEYRVLVVLQSQGETGVVALQRAMLIDKAWISRTLASLSDKKLVACEADPHDARRTRFRLTAKGQRTATALVERAFKRQERILAGFSAKEVQQLMAQLDRIQANVEPREE
ncbi:MAG: winged helix-turn-helix transcriptional regulator [Burkholderiales bacterium]|nr:winged helix-turn-helix transcriptional regulator [Burkholderiales bacterium]